MADFNHIFQVKFDDSGIAIGSMLSQEEKYIIYLSEKLNESKNKNSYYDNEFYIVIQALKHWSHYLMPREFVLFSDNHALQFIMQQPKMNQKHAKWVEFLQGFTFVLKHSSARKPTR